MKTEEELWALLREAYHMPYGSAQIALVEQVVQHADAGGHDELRFAARLHATTAYVHGGETAKSFVTFSWCRSEYDAHPERFDRQDEHLLLWQFKYMVSGLLKFPSVPLGRTYDVLDDMERRFRAGGHSLHAVFAYRHHVAAHLGDPAAEDWYAKWCAAPRDDNSDCAGCDPTQKVDHLSRVGRDEEAVQLAGQVLSGQLTCAEQPQSMLTSMLFPYLRTGRLTEAADAHRRAYRSLRGNLADLQSIGEHVEFCARTGNETRGLELVQRHLAWLDTPPHPQAEMWFAASAALLLGRLGGGVTVGDSTAEALGERLARRARSLAAQFDERNGNPAVSGRIEATLSAEPLVEQLPLSAIARRHADAAAAGLGGAGAPAGGAALAAARPAEPLPTDPAELLDRAWRLYDEHRIDDAAAAFDRFDELHPAPPPELAVRRLDGRARLTATRQHGGEESAAMFLEVAAAQRALGDDLAALASQARAVLAGPAGEAMLVELQEVTEQILAHPDAPTSGGREARSRADLRAEARLRLEYPLIELERYEEALATVEAALAEQPGPVLGAELVTHRARCLLLLERFDEAAAVAAEAREQYSGLGEPPAAGVAALVHAHALANLERFDAAVDAFDAALAAAFDRPTRLSALVGRGRARLAADRPEDAIEDLVEVVADHVAHGEDPPAALLRYDLAGAYARAGQPLDAAEAAESAIEVLDRIGAQEQADQTRYLLSRIYRELDETDQALALLETLATNLDGFDNLPSRGRMLQEAAQLLYGVDRDAQAAERFAAAAEAFRAAGVVPGEMYNRRLRALALRWAGDVDGSLAALAEADALAQSLTGTVEGAEPWLVWQRAMLDCDAARVFMGAGRLDEAGRRVEGVGDTLRSIGSLSEALDADFLHAEVLMRAGDAPGAEPLLRSVLGSAPRGVQIEQNSAWMLAECLEAQGRADEAARIRSQYLDDPSQ
jgi:tetratricopeptide (TPR) repeat protein